MPLAAVACCAFAQSRQDNFDEHLRIENVELKRDNGTLKLATGEISFLEPVSGHRTTAVFTGEGVFHLKPAIPIEGDHLNKVTGKSEIDEAFDSAVFFFTDETYTEVKSQTAAMPADPKAAQVLKNVREKLKQDVNTDVELLGEMLNPKRGASFRAYLHGKKYSDLRFFMIPSGALPGFMSPEEVAVIDEDEGHAGIWYLSHLQSEWDKGTASSLEDKRDIRATHYKIDTEVGKGGALTASTDMDFTTVLGGARVLRIDLLPSLHVKKVTDERNRAITYIQAGESLHVIWPEALEAGSKHTLHFEYEGSKVIRNEGSGNFSVAARSSWYPNVNSFLDHATYDLKFRSPKNFTLVSVGKLVSETKEGGDIVSEWKCDVPIPVAGFNYGEYKKKAVSDPDSKYDIEVYATSQMPGVLAEGGPLGTLTPSAMAQNALVDAQNSIRLFQLEFGAAPFGRLAVTQQPAFFYGQSWPTLVYLPVSAFLDSTQRWTLLGQEAFRFANFVQEVTPHEVSHQWWGHTVGWATYHDQWLSEGFAEFSAGLFVEATEKPPEVQKFWDRLHTEILEKNNFGQSANDAGPVWLGIRLNTPKNPNAYRSIVYSKGAYLLQMIRMLMRDEKTGDQDFISMMKDYVQENLYKNATSESFMAVVTKHMKPSMDADGSHNMEWFKREWIYGSALPKYRLEYSLKASADGKTRFTGKLTQSDVPADFVMRVPIYFDFDGRVIRAGLVSLRGNMTSSEINIDLPKRPKRALLNANHDVLAAESVVKEAP